MKLFPLIPNVKGLPETTSLLAERWWLGKDYTRWLPITARDPEKAFIFLLLEQISVREKGVIKKEWILFPLIEILSACSSPGCGCEVSSQGDIQGVGNKLKTQVKAQGL